MECIFAVPTGSAATELHARISKLMGQVHPLVVGRVVRAVPGMIDTDHATNIWDEQLTLPTWALGSARRVMAAPIAVGTIVPRPRRPTLSVPYAAATTGQKAREEITKGSCGGSAARASASWTTTRKPKCCSRSPIAADRCSCGPRPRAGRSCT